MTNSKVSYGSNWYQGPFPRGKARCGHDGDHSTPSSAEAENELYMTCSGIALLLCWQL